MKQKELNQNEPKQNEKKDIINNEKNKKDKKDNTNHKKRKPKAIIVFLCIAFIGVIATLLAGDIPQRIAQGDWMEAIRNKESEQEEVILHVLAADKNSVIVNLQNNTDEYFEHGDIFEVSRKTMTGWKEVPRDYISGLVGEILPEYSCEILEWNLTGCGELKDGHYRIDFEGLTAEFDIPMSNKKSIFKRKKSKKLLENATDMQMMYLTYFDGNNTQVKEIWELDRVTDIIEELNNVMLVPDKADKVMNMNEPYYGVSAFSADGELIQYVYSDGIWLALDGSVYNAQYDMKTLYEDVFGDDEFVGNGGFEMANASLLCHYDKRCCSKASEVKVREDINVKVKSVDAQYIHASFHNPCDYDIKCREIMKLQKNIDGAWYDIPMKYMNQSMGLFVVLDVPKGESITKDLSLKSWSALQPGNYRFVIGDIAAEFTVKTSLAKRISNGLFDSNKIIGRRVKPSPASIVNYLDSLERSKNKEKNQDKEYMMFGSYPQAEVVARNEDKERIPSVVRDDKRDFIVDSDLYAKLENAKWNQQNETVVDGVRYRRMKKSDCLYKTYNPAENEYNYDSYEEDVVSDPYDYEDSDDSESEDDYADVDDSESEDDHADVDDNESEDDYEEDYDEEYDDYEDYSGDDYAMFELTDYLWEYREEEKYHYFQYQPIKWRVLSKNDNTAFVVSELLLDAQPYHGVEPAESDEEGDMESDVTWDESTMRSFLNCYDGSMNSLNMDCSKIGFYETAFSKEEKECILPGDVCEDTFQTMGITLGCSRNDHPVKDKVFLLSPDDISNKNAAIFGFDMDESAYDEKRRASCSAYAVAMGCEPCTRKDTFENLFYMGKSNWWLRSDDKTRLVVQAHGGLLYWDGYTDYHNGVRPAMKIKIK